MKIFFLFFAAFAAICFSSVQAQTCAKLSDPGNAIATTLNGFGAGAVIDIIAKSEDADKCIGSMDTEELTSALMDVVGDSTCAATVGYVQGNPFEELTGYIEELQKADGVMGQLAAVGKITSYLKAMENKTVGEFCGMHTTNIAPCIVNKVLPVVDELLRKNSCCNDLLSKMKPTLGSDDIVDFGYTAVKRVSNLVCAERDVLSGVSGDKGGYCGYVALQSAVRSDALGTVNSALPYLKISNDESCNAFKGSEYVNVDDSKTTIAPVYMDACGKAFADVFGFANSIPALTSMKMGGSTIGDLFGDGTTLKAADLIDALGLPSLVSGLLGTNLHVPSKVDASCEIINRLTECDYPPKPTPKPTTPAPTTPAPTTPKPTTPKPTTPAPTTPAPTTPAPTTPGPVTPAPTTPAPTTPSVTSTPYPTTPSVTSTPYPTTPSVTSTPYPTPTATRPNC